MTSFFTLPPCSRLGTRCLVRHEAQFYTTLSSPLFLLPVVAVLGPQQHATGALLALLRLGDSLPWPSNSARCIAARGVTTKC